MSLRPFVASVGTGIALMLLAAASVVLGVDEGPRAATLLLMYAVCLPALTALHVDALGRFAGSPVKVPLWSVAAVGLGAAVYAWPDPWAALAGAVLMAAGGTLQAVLIMKAVPKTSLVDEDPLTKGDDACMKHIVFAHRFLPLALMALTAAAIGAFWDVPRIGIVATHLFVVGYVLLSVYGLGHLWVPRFSGVPAIAAGAIKGELHTTLLGIVGLVLGFSLASPGLLMGLGFFVFVGFFTYMGVLGANMMRNKSRTQRVTPEFTYIPWTFTAIFWLISSVLMGLFLNAVPDELADKYAGLRNLHLTAGLLGGVVQLIMGILTRAVAMELGRSPPPFQGALRASFFAFNIGLALWMAGSFTPTATAETVGLGLLAFALLSFVLPLSNLFPHPVAAET